MKYSVIWKQAAVQKLAEIWLAAADKEAVNRAVSQIDAYLAQAASVGEDYLLGTRLLVAPPLVVVYDISHADCRATVSKVAFRP